MPKLPLIDLVDESIAVKVDHEFRTSASPAENTFGDQQPATAVRKFFVTPWEARDRFAKWVLGEVGINVDVSPPVLTRTPPQRHPKFPDMVATRIVGIKGYLPAPGSRITGAGTTTYPLPDYAQSDGAATEQNYKLAKYESAIIDVEYTHVRYNPWGDGQLISEGYSPSNEGEEMNRYTEVMDPKTSAEYLQLPGMLLYYTRTNPAAGKPHGHAIPYGIGLILPLEEFTIVWRRLPYSLVDPFSDWSTTIGQSGAGTLSPIFKRIYGDPDDPDDYTKRPYLGTINKTTIFGRAAGTLCLTGFASVRRSGPTPESWEVDLFYTFTFDPNRGWDRKYFHPNDGVGTSAGWYYVSRSKTYYEHGSIPDKDSQYDEREFRNLFVIGEIA
jgi:hypothetical protein